MGKHGKSQQAVNPQLYSIRGAAVALGVSPATIQGWLRQGRLRYHRVGSRTRLVLEEVLALQPPKTFPPPESKRSRSAASGQFCRKGEQA
jgi:excisionase family DNA binding protein